MRVQRKNLSSLKPALISWCDAEGTAGWVDLDEIMNEPLPVQHSIGFVIEENKEFVHLAMSIDPRNGCVAETLKIPKKWIVQRL